MFLQIFGTPHNHPKSKPFFDRVMNFAIVDNRIWIRNYQVMKVNILRDKRALLFKITTIFNKTCQVRSLILKK